MLKNLAKKCQKLFFDHWFIIASGLLLVVLIESPLFVFPFIAKDAYRGINFIEFGCDSHFYLSRGKEILDDNGLGSSVIREGKDNPNYYFSAIEYILVKPIVWLGVASKVTIVQLYNIYNFISVFVIILLIYNLVLQMSGGKKFLAATTALFVVGGSSIIESKHFFYNEFNIYSRPVFPYTISLVFFLYLNLLYKSLISHKKILIGIAGMVFGLLFYIYSFGWSFAAAITAILLILYFLKKDFASAKKVIYIFCIGFATGAYNLFRIFSFILAPASKNFSYFSHLLHTHTPIFVNVGFVMLIFFIIFSFQRRDDKNLPFILSLILAGWVALNQQIVTGKLLQYNHYYWYFIIPISIIVGFYMLWFLLNSDRWRKMIFIIFLVVAFLNTIVGQYRSILAANSFRLYEQNFKPFIDYLNSVPSRSVVLAADETVSLLFTVYTPHDLFWFDSAAWDGVPMEHIKDVLFMYLYLNKDARGDAENYLNTILNDQNNNSFYKNIYLLIEGYSSGLDYDVYLNKIANGMEITKKHREETITFLSKGYKDFIKNPDNIQSLLQKYYVNYIVWDKNKHPEWDLSVMPNLKQVIVSDNIYLYNLSVQ